MSTVFCPHCGAHTISAWDRLTASYTKPIVCSQCSGLSLHGGTARRAALLSILGAVFLCFMFVGSVMLSPESWWRSFVMIVPGLVVLGAAYRLAVPIIPVDGGEVQSGRRIQLIASIALPLLALVILLICLALARLGG